MTQHNTFPQMQLDGTNWTDVTASVLQAEGIDVESGFAQEGTLRPSKIRWTFNNATDAWRPSSPTSPLYAGSGRGIKAAIAMDLAVAAVGEASRYAPDETIDFNAAAGRGRRTVDFEAEGILRRISSWTSVVRSPMYRQVTGYATLRGYWPVEDGKDATQLTNAARGGRPGFVDGVTLGGDGPDGGAAAGVIGESGTSLASGWFNSMSSTAGYQISVATKLKQLPLNGTSETLFRWRTSTGQDIMLNVNNAVYTLRVFNDETMILDAATLFGGGASPNQWIQFRFKVYQSGGNVTIELGWNPQGDGFLYGTTQTYAGSVGRPLWWRVVQNQHTAGMSFGQVFAVTGVSDNLQSYAMLRAFDGYVGELAAERFQRLCNQYSLPWVQWGLDDDTMPMGRQRATALLELLKEIMTTEDGLIFDVRTNTGLHLRTRRNLWQQTPKITYAYATHIAAPLTEVLDDLGIANVVTVKQLDGSEYTAALEAGPMSTLDPPTGIGAQEQQIDVNVSDEAVLEGIAEWRLSRGTVPGARWPQVTVDLDRPGVSAADMQATVELTPGDRIKITGRTPEPIDLMVIGINHKSDTLFRRKSVLTCIPYAPFLVGIWGSNPAGHRYDSGSSTVNAGHSTTATSWVINTANRDDCWSTTAVPYDCIAAGERVTVTAMTAPTGTGPYLQTATLTRSVNGVVKTHVAGEKFSLADPVRYGL